MTNLKKINENYWQNSLYGTDKKGFIAPALRSKDSLRYVLDCIDNGYEILGVSGFFYFDDGSIQPNQSFELDYENFVNKSTFFGALGKILFENMDNNVVFEIFVR